MKRTLHILPKVVLALTLLTMTQDTGTAENILFMNDSTDPLYIYEDSSLEGIPIAVLNPHGVGYIVDSVGTVLKIESGEYSGFIKKENLLYGSSAKKKAEEFGKQAVIQGDTVFVNEMEEMDGRITALLSAGDVVSVTDEKEDILEIVTEDNLEGYIFFENARVKPVFQFAEELILEEYYEHPSINGLGTYQSEEEYDLQHGLTERGLSGKKIVEYASRFIGNPYVWGGDSLTEGADCSGFVKSVYEYFGISLPRTSKEQRFSGIKVCDGWDESAAAPGDLVCYDGHVGIYAGFGQIIHAANEKEGIRVSKADYRNDIICVRRIIGSCTLNTQEKEILCRIVEAEAGGEEFNGKLLVANVILNRVEDKNFPDSVKTVVFQENGGKHQFSSIKDGRYEKVKISNESRRAVSQALRGNDPSKGALYFLNPRYSESKNVRWFQESLEYLFTYGNHAFYK